MNEKSHRALRRCYESGVATLEHTDVRRLCCASCAPPSRRVRLDRGFATAKLFTFLEREQVDYVVAMASNRRLEKRPRRLMGRARVLSRHTGATAHLYGDTRYAAKTWPHQRRVIIKAEVVRHSGRAPKNNPRFVVTNLPLRPQAVYALYCQRGDVENRLKELHHGLEMTALTASSPALVGSRLEFRGTVTGKSVLDGEGVVEVEFRAVNDQGDHVSGTAAIGLPIAKARS
jgi:hypothetical protein